MVHMCEKCASEFEGDFFLCEGFCSSKVCMRCTGLTESTLAMKDTNSHLIWICNCCKRLLSNSRFKNAMISCSKVNDDFVEALKTSLKSEIHDSILRVIRSEIRSGLKDFPTPKLTPLVNSLDVPPLGAKRRRIEANQNGTPRRSPLPRMCAVGTNCTNSDISTASARTSETRSEATFSLFLSGIQPSVPDERVLEMVRSHLGDDNVKARKLLPRGRDVNTLSFVSFKLDMHPDLKIKALSTETWPVGIRFREFSDNVSNKVFWNPLAAPIPVVQTTPFVTPTQ